jgi:hypothetical protein
VYIFSAMRGVYLDRTGTFQGELLLIREFLFFFFTREQYGGTTCSTTATRRQFSPSSLGTREKAGRRAQLPRLCCSHAERLTNCQLKAKNLPHRERAARCANARRAPLPGARPVRLCNRRVSGISHYFTSPSVQVS